METENVDDAEELVLLEEVSERTGARINAWWRCKSCKTKKWKERAPKTIFKHAINCGFPEDLCARLRSGFENAKLVEQTNETPESGPQPQLKSILKKKETPPLTGVGEWKEPEPEPEDLERLELASKLKRPVIQVDPVFHIPGKSGWTLRADSTARRRHIRILSDILYVSIHRRDWQRAKRAWGLLLRTPEVEWTDIWRVGILLLHTDVDIDKRQASEGRVVFPRAHFLNLANQNSQRETILQELVIELILAKDFKQAEGQLFMYMAEYPFYDNATLRGLSGLLYLYNAQPRPSTPPETRPEGGDHSSSSNSSDEDQLDESESKESDSFNEKSSRPNKCDTTETPNSPEPPEPLDFRLFEPNRLRAARHHFRAALRIDERNTLAYGFLVLLGDEMVQSALPQSRSSSLRFSDSDSDEESSPPPPVLPISAFRSPSISSDLDEVTHHPKKTGPKERVDRERLRASSTIKQREVEAGSSTASQVGTGRYVSSASSSDHLRDLTHDHTSDRLDSPNACPTSPLTPKASDQISPKSPDVPTSNNPQSSAQPPNHDSGRRLSLSRDGIPEQSSSRNTSEMSMRASRFVRFLEPSSGDDKDSGRRKKKARR
ncbi:hypothetical protein M407DRAFT_223588 [Tulasnella calospora MUT 4182]|uniref:Uncharacterized protein n=1 Tax=Tulasnella calospora MUT 4182 TaxID=1051891 RepID=A0A0C3PVZ4_9AGAM|nr:hypothetical protein M407DRAFT_223588 [Tulasnella calospora MUT 4182]